MLMNKFLKLSLSTAIAGILTLPCLHVAAQEKNNDVLNPTGSWSAKAMAANSDNGYCALSRQYEQDLILTLGQNKMEEYSFAIDFTKATLNPDRAYDVTLQPSPGQIRAYEMMPASARAMVIRLGYDDSFVKALSESGELKAEIDGKNYTFNVNEFSKGNQSLEQCMASLGTVPKIKVASTKFEVKKIESVDVVKPIPAPIVERAPEPEETVEVVQDVPEQAVKISKASSTKSEVEKVAEQEVQKVASSELEAPRPPAIQISKVDSKVVSEEVNSQEVAQAVEDARVEAEKKAKAIEEAERKVLEEKRLAEEKAQKALEVQRAAEAKAQAEKEERLAQEQAEREKAQRLAEEQKREAEEEQEAKRLAEAQRKAEETKKVEEEKIVSLSEMPQDVSQDVTPTTEFSSRPFENRYEVLETGEAKEAKENLDKLENENNRLSQALADEEKKMAGLDMESAEAETELAKIKERMRELEEENRALYLEARQARGAVDSAVVKTGNQALTKIREYEKKLEAARMDNVALSKEIEELRRLKEDGKLQAVAGDWDLEKSTKRYNEAEREIKRLGMLLEQQRLSHRQEKQELEQMLFDPAVTEKEQQRRLTELELQLAAAEKELQRSGRASITRAGSMPSVQAPAVPRAPMSERVDIYERETNFPRVEDTPMAISSRPAPTVEQSERRVTPLSPYAPMAVDERVANIEPATTQRSTISKMPETSSASVPNVVSIDPTQVAGFNAQNLQTILNKSGVGLNGTVRESKSGQYQWRAGKLSGHAKVISQGQAGNIDAFANQYIAEKKQSCSGDFASLPSPMVSNGKAFELACVTPTNSMSSSVVFTQKGNDIVVIGHDIPAEDMDLAMDARDRIADNL